MILIKHISSIITVVFMMLSFNAVGQLHVGSSPYTYIYNTNQVVYVEKDIELKAATSFFYLRNDGQLLQGTTSTGINKGIGSLSVFQEGTVNNYAYNYWCAPVGGNIATAGNSPFGITQLGVPTTTVATNNATILPITNYNGISTAGSLSISPYWIWKFSVNDAYADWIFSGSASNIAAGEGFTMKGVSGSDITVVDGITNNTGSNQRYDFRGKPNDGTINIPVAHDGFPDGEQVTLTGNPYPSAIDLSMFLTDATNSTGIAYFWEHDKTVNSHILANYIGGYGVFSPISRGGTGIYVPAVFSTYVSDGIDTGDVASPGIVYKRRFSPIGQGFMIEGSSNGNVQMKNSYRVFVKEAVSNFSEFEKNSSSSNKSSSESQNDYLQSILSVSGFDYTTVSKLPVPQIRFKSIIDDTKVSQMVLAFEETATDSIDFAMDAKSMNADLEEEIYFDINNIPHVINVITFDETKRIPLGFRNTSEANYHIEISEILNFDTSQNIYIYDKEKETYHDLMNSAFNITMPEGVNTNRFEITFTTESILNIPDSAIIDFSITQNNSTQNLIITNLKNIDIKNINVFDISGKLVFTENKLGSENQYNFSTSRWSDGVYIVNLASTDNKIESKKVVVSKTN